MALWFKKKEESARVLEFNLAKLNTELQNLSDKIYSFKNEASLAVIKEVIEMARNIHILQVNLAKDEKASLIHQGGLRALSQLLRYIEGAVVHNIEQRKEGKPREVRDVLKMRRSSNQAGPAL